MANNLSSEEKLSFNQSIQTFSNLFKEFPKKATEDFIYDESTLKKIGDAEDALNEITSLINQISKDLEEQLSNEVKQSLKILSQLMEELPKDAADEFLYDRLIHRQVEDSRETIAKLGALFS